MLTKQKQKPKSKFFSFLLIFFLCCLIGTSIGLGLFYSNAEITPDIEVIAEVATKTTTGISAVIHHIISYLSSEEFTKFLPTLQGIITTVAASLGIIMTVKNLRKKD